MGWGHGAPERDDRVCAAHLPCISPISPLYLPYISPERDDLVREACGGAAHRSDLE